MKEVWKDVIGFEGHYQVSNSGKVRSMNYNHTNEIKNLVPHKNHGGYLWVNFHLSGKNNPRLIHRLVAEAFIPNPDKHPQINHKDENKENNNVENLEWCTQSYNAKYYLDRHPGKHKERLEKARAARKPRQPKEQKPRKIATAPKTSRLHLKVIQMTTDGEFVKEWANSNEVKHETGWCASSITRCCQGARKTAYGFRWRYAI